MNLERRSFIKGAAIAGGSGLLAGLVGCGENNNQSVDSLATDTEKIDWSIETDVVVVGAGGGGLAAALEAADAGQEVTVVEVMSNQGMSNTAICAGMIQGAVTSVQKEAGIEDSVEEFDKFLTAIAEGFEDPDLRRLYAEKSGETIDWLIDLGATLGPDSVSTTGTTVDLYAHITPPVARMHQAPTYSGSYFTDVVFEAAEAAGATFLFDTRATKLVTNVDGEVIGVIVDKNGKESKIKARKGVVLAAGGFTRNIEMVNTFMTPALPKMATDVPILMSYGSPWQKGDGIIMGQAVGAKLNIPWVAYQMAPGIAATVADNSGGHGLPGPCVLTDGSAYETLPNVSVEEQIADIWKQPQGFVWSIWDQAKVDASAESGGIAFRIPSLDLKPETEEGTIRKADSIAELATMLEVDPDVLQEAIDKYNAALTEDSNKLPVQEGPFYAGRVVAVSPDTAGGMAINTNTQVLDVYGEVIPRLYAVGLNAGGFKGKICAGCGQALGWTFASGRIVGQHISTLNPAEQ